MPETPPRSVSREAASPCAPMLEHARHILATLGFPPGEAMELQAIAVARYLETYVVDGGTAAGDLWNGDHERDAGPPWSPRTWE